MRRWSALFLALITLLPLSACVLKEKEPAAESGYGLWFPVDRASDRSDSSAVAREGRDWEEVPTAEQLMQALLDGPESADLHSPFPYGVTMRSLSIDETTRMARVDLSEQYGGLMGFELSVADYCIALTLCQLSGIEAVRITVEGKTIPYRNLQTMRPGDLLLSGIAEEPDTFLAALYFPSRGGGLTAEYRQVTRIDDSSAVEIVMNELLRGPMVDEGSLPLPEGTEVRSLSVDNGVCQVDLTEEFLLNAPEEGELAGLTLYALVNTLCIRSGVSQVRLLVEGESVASYGGVSTGGPLNANFDLVND